MDARKKIIFITGGARSGKSTFARTEAEKIKGDKLFIATAEPLDDEMKERIQNHRSERDAGWETVEEPVELSDVFADLNAHYSVVLVDCMTLWISNILMKSEMDANTNVQGMIDEFIRALLSEEMNVTFFIVSNEVGMGIVPDNKLARIFRDVVGKANQRVADISDEVYFVVSGIPVRVK